MAYSNTYTYTGKILNHIDDLEKSLKESGIEAFYTYKYDGNLIVESDESEASVTAAVDGCLSGTLFANKHEKMRGVQSKSEQLVSKGVECWSAGHNVKCKKREADDYFTDFKYFSEHPEKLTPSTPYVLTDLDDNPVTTSVASDIENIANASTDRLLYLYTSLSNGDGSFGEVPMMSAIHDAVDQEALDLIVDTRT